MIPHFAVEAPKDCPSFFLKPHKSFSCHLFFSKLANFSLQKKSLAALFFSLLSTIALFFDFYTHHAEAFIAVAINKIEFGGALGQRFKGQVAVANFAERHLSKTFKANV